MANATLTAVPTFRCGAAACGIKSGGGLDVAVLMADRLCAAAGVFTTNKVQAAPVLVCKEHLRRSRGRARAVVVCAGNANACTGPRGLRDAQDMCRLTARLLDVPEHHVLVASTGIIGQPLPMAKVRRGIRAAVAALSRSAEAGRRFARAILTTDTQPKSAARSVRIDGRTYHLAGAIKGAGMIGPELATMLGFVATDAPLRPAALRRLLRHNARRLFNRASVDAHTSTNDTILALACAAESAAWPGPAAVPERAPTGRGRAETTLSGSPDFDESFEDLCLELMYRMLADGEGVTKVVPVLVLNARSDADADRMARAIGDSPLVKCAVHGQDPNWGRIISAAGAAGAAFDPDRAECAINGVVVFRRGRPVAGGEARARVAMRAAIVAIVVNVNMGRGAAAYYTTDLSAEYVRINAEYHT